MAAQHGGLLSPGLQQHPRRMLGELGVRNAHVPEPRPRAPLESHGVCAVAAWRQWAGTSREKQRREEPQDGYEGWRGPVGASSYSSVAITG
ncbi:uncharacterized protein LOC144300374 isoform X2 [Canis aureus]